MSYDRAAEQRLDSALSAAAEAPAEMFAITEALAGIGFALLAIHYELEQQRR